MTLCIRLFSLVHLDCQHSNRHVGRRHKAEFLFQLKNYAGTGGQKDVAFGKQEAHGFGEGCADFVNNPRHLRAAGGCCKFLLSKRLKPAASDRRFRSGKPAASFRVCRYKGLLRGRQGNSKGGKYPLADCRAD